MTVALEMQGVVKTYGKIRALVTDPGGVIQQGAEPLHRLLHPHGAIGPPGPR